MRYTATKLVTVLTMMLVGLGCSGSGNGTTSAETTPGVSAPEPAPAPVSPLVGQVTRQSLDGFYQRLLRLAPRPAGSQMLQDCRLYLVNTLKSFGLKVSQEPFAAYTPDGRIEMANVIAEKPGTSNRIIYLATHIDTKKLPGVRFMGANDSTSSTAAVLELARIIAAADTHHTYRFAFFDGEEALGENMTATDGLYGSRHHAEQLARDGEAVRVRAVILLDMIGDRDLDVIRDENSSAGLYSLFAQCCDRLGFGDILSGDSTWVLDDHVPFRNLGIPTLDIIDFNYGPDNAYWHTGSDTAAHVSVESIERVTRAVTCMLSTLDAE